MHEMYLYHDRYGAYPPVAVTSVDGKELMSWRVLVARELEPEAYGHVELSSDWRSPGNYKMLSSPPVWCQCDECGEGAVTELGSTFLGLPGKTGELRYVVVVRGVTSPLWMAPDDLDMLLNAVQECRVLLCLDEHACYTMSNSDTSDSLRAGLKEAIQAYSAKP